MMVINNINDLNETLSVHVDDRSYRYRRIMADDKVFLYFSLPEFIEILPGAWITYQGAKYTMNKPADFKKNHSRHYDYTLEFDSPAASLLKYRLRDVVERRLKFPLLANARQHLQMIVDNLNMRESGWTMGSCIETPAKLISYNHTTLAQALQMVADNFETEFEIVEKEISLGRIERNQSDPIALSYGKGNGFLPGVGRFNDVESAAIKVLHVQGGARNINRSSYGSPTLLLPASQTLQYEGSLYEVSADGHTVSLSDAPAQSPEGSLDLADIYPSRVGEISQVIPVNPSGNFYDFVDSSIPEGLDFNDCHMPGEKMTVIFQSGMLAGREFEISAYKHALRRFEIVPAQEDGLELPSGPFVPAVGDTYAIFGIELPAAYIREDSTQSGASWDMLREAVRYLHDNSRPKFSFTGTLDGIWAKKDWLNIGGRIQLGSYVLFSDPTFEPAGVNIRIVGIKDFVNSPESPELELSNNVISSSFTSRLAKIEQNEVVTQELHRQSMSFTKRRFNDATKTISMLEQAFSNNFTKAISPAAIHTMAALVGDESLQFRFVNSTTNPQEVTHVVTYNQSTLILNAPAGIIQHMTLGLESISPGHQTSEYHFWNVAAFNSPPLSNPESSYYLYIKANKASMAASFALSESPIAFEHKAGYYHLLVGILNAELAGERSYVSLYGFTEILPGRITTNKIVSADGNTFIDLQTGDIQGKFTFRSGRDVEEVVEEVADSIDAVQVGGRNLILNSSFARGHDNWGTSGGSGHTIATGASDYPSASSVKRSAKWTNTAAAGQGITALTTDSWPLLENGKEYVITCWVKANSASTFSLHVYGDSGDVVDSFKAFSVNTDWQKIVHIITGDGQSNPRVRFFGRNNGVTYWVNCPKVELGNKATDWSPAPEDVDAEIATAKQEALTAAAAAQTTANTANATVGNLNTYVDGAFKDGVIDAAEAKAIEKYKNTLNETMAKAEASYNKVYTNTYLEGTAKTSLLNAKVNLWGQKDTLLSAINTAISGGTTTPAQKTAVDSAFSTFNNLMTAFQNALEEANRAIQVKLDNISKGYADAVQVGGRNLLLGTKDFTGWINNNTAENSTLFSGLKMAQAKGIVNTTIGLLLDYGWNFKIGEVYTISVWARTDTPGSTIKPVTGITNIPSEKIVTSDWARYSWVYTSNYDQLVRFRFETQSESNVVYITAPKIELGNRATDWTPAPEDVPSSLEYLAKAIQGSTEIDGGLTMTNLLLLKNLAGQITGGMSGLDGDNVLLFGGGDYQAALDSAVQTLIRKDGTGLLGGGIVQWDLAGMKVGDLDIDSSGAVLLKESGVLKLLITRNAIMSPEALIGGGQSSETSFTSTTNVDPGVTEVIKGTYTINNDGTEVTVTTTLSALLQLSQPHGYSTATIRIIARYPSSGIDYVFDSYSLSASGTTDDKTGSESVNATIILPAGTMQLVVRFENVNSVPGAPAGFNCSASAGTIKIFHSVSNPHSEIGKNGFMFGKDSYNFAYFGVDNSNKFRVILRSVGDFDLPGVLLRGTVDATGGNSTTNWWGPKKVTTKPSRTSTGRYVVYHNVGHVNYTVSATPRTSNRSCHVVSKANTQFIIEWRSIGSSPALIDTEFDFQISGLNFLAP